MAGIDKRGLMPIATPFCGIGTNKYRVQPGTTKLFIGDPAEKNAAGTVEIGGTGANEAILGPFLEFFDDEGVAQNFYPGGSETGWTCVIADDPNQQFMIAEDDGTGIITDIGGGANLISGTGDEVTGMSKYLMDSTSMGATAGTEQLIVIDFVDRLDNNIGDTNAQWHVRINLHQNAPGATPV